MDSLVEQALRTRPELKQSQALLSAARAAKNGAVYGPLIPSVGAQAFGGGLGGGPDSGPSNFGAEADYLVGLIWRIGPGGLFDAGRVNAGKARLAAAQLGEAKLKDTITSQVVVSLTRVQSLWAQIALAERNLATATETLRLTRERKQYGVGIVLEDIQAQQDLTQARSEYFTALAEYNKAQYALNKAVGGLQATRELTPTLSPRLLSPNSPAITSHFPGSGLLFCILPFISFCIRSGVGTLGRVMGGHQMRRIFLANGLRQIVHHPLIGRFRRVVAAHHPHQVGQVSESLAHISAVRAQFLPAPALISRKKPSSPPP